MDDDIWNAWHIETSDADRSDRSLLALTILLKLTSFYRMKRFYIETTIGAAERAA